MLQGSDILIRGQAWTVLGIRDNRADIERGGTRASVSIPAAWRAYAAMTAALDAEAQADRDDVRCHPASRGKGEGPYWA
jgi:hypothetical protein